MQKNIQRLFYFSVFVISFLSLVTSNVGFSHANAIILQNGLGSSTTLGNVNNIQSSSQCFPITSADNTVQITTASDGQGNIICNNGSSGTNSIQIYFQGVGGTALSTFQCALDSQAFVSCTSPVTQTGLSIGSHTFQVRGVATTTTTGVATLSWTVTGTNPAALRGTLPFAASTEDSHCLGGLSCGTYFFDSNGLTGTLIIKSVDNQGKINGTLFGQAINGSWNQVLKKITFTQTIRSGSNNLLTYEYSGFYHNLCNIIPTTSCSALSGFAIPKTVQSEQAAKQEFGWISIFLQGQTALTAAPASLSSVR